jgi:hypothetical protein
MPDRPRRSLRVVVPRPDRIRTLDDVAFGWLDARLQHDGWLRVLTPEALAVYAFLCLAADRSGVSYYRRSRMTDELGLDDTELSLTLARLRELDLIAYQPFRAGATDGFHQVLSIPGGGPPMLIPDDVIAVDRLVGKTQD